MSIPLLAHCHKGTIMYPPLQAYYYEPIIMSAPFGAIIMSPLLWAHHRKCTTLSAHHHERTITSLLWAHHYERTIRSKHYEPTSMSHHRKCTALSAHHHERTIMSHHYESTNMSAPLHMSLLVLKASMVSKSYLNAWEQKLGRSDVSAPIESSLFEKTPWHLFRIGFFHTVNRALVRVAHAQHFQS